MNSAARLFERRSKQSRQLATRAISGNSQADFHQHVSATLLAAAQEGFRLPCPCCECPAIAKRFQKLVAGDGPKLAM